MSRIRWLALLLAAPTILACADSGGSPTVVASAAGLQWTVEEAAALLAADEEVAATEEAVRALANLWTDYTILATAAAEDTSMTRINVAPLVQELADQELLRSLRNSAIQADTLIELEELQRLYAEEAPGSIARARHILLRWPEDATQAQRDSVISAVQELRRRVTDGGEDFGEVAAEFSQDPGTAAQGGDTGYFRRDQMVASFSEAAFSLEPGETSPPVETPYGAHLIRVEERQTPTPAAFRIQLLNRRSAVAESTFVAGLEAIARPEIEDDAFEVIREFSMNPRTRLSGGEANRTLATYQGGRVTTGEALRYLRSQAPQSRNLVGQAQDRWVQEDLLRGLLHRELLLWEAGRQGWSVPASVREDLAQNARRNLSEAAAQLSLMPSEGEGWDQSTADAVKGRVSALLEGILSGERREITPLGPMVYVLQDAYETEVSEAGILEVVRRVALERGSGG